MSNKVVIPTDTASLVIARKEAGNIKSSISVGKDGHIIPKSNKDSLSDYTVIVRSSKREGPRETSRTAVKLKACKGKKGCEFAKCVEDAFGKIPRNFQRLCPTGIESKVK